MSEQAWVVFDPTGRMICRHCGRNEYLRVSALSDVLTAGQAFLETHSVCPSQSEVTEQRMGEGGA